MRRIGWLFLLALTPSMLACGGGGNGAAGTGGSGGSGGKPTTDQQMFSALGIDTTVTPRTYVDTSGVTHTLGDSYNPLGRGVKTLHALPEFFMVGRGIGGAAGSEVLLDDFKHAPVTIAAAPVTLPLADPSPSWTQNEYTATVVADLDGDGTDEIVNLYWVASSTQLHANVVRCTPGTACTGNGGSFSVVKDTLLAVTAPAQTPASHDWFKHGFAAADVDGDGKQELVVANFGGVHVCTAAADFSFSCALQVANSSNTMSVARGHFEETPDKLNDDLVVAFGNTAGTLGYVAIYDGTPNAFSSNAFTHAGHDPQPLSVLFADQSTVWSYADAYVAAGDVDGDGSDEILLAAHRLENGADYGHHDLVLMDDSSTSYRFFTAWRYFLGTNEGHTDDGDNQRFKSPLQMFTKRTQMTATGVTIEKAIYAGSTIIDGLDKIPASTVTTIASGGDITAGVGGTRMSYYENGGGSYNHAPDEVAIGDIDGTGQDVIIAMWDETNELTDNDHTFLPATIARAGWDAGTGVWTRWTNIITTTSGNTQTVCDGGDCHYPISLAMPNIDHDSAVVKYTGQHELLFSVPRILAVLAAPPFVTGVNSTNSQTSIAFGTGVGFGTQGTIGVSSGVSIGYTAPSLFGLTTLSWKLTFGASIDWISSSNVELDETETWTTSTEDAVVFSVIPFDVYYYQVVSSSDPTDVVGSTMSINVPRKLDTYKVPVALYNASIVDGPQIDSAILTHTVGDPSSYPTENSCDTATGTGSFGQTSYLVDGSTWCYASASPLHTGIGSGSVGFTIARTDSASSGVSTDLSVEFDFEAGAGGFTAGVSSGFHWGYQYTLDTSQSYNFAGQVGDLPDATHGYDFGLMAHRGNLAGRIDYPAFVVDYWVANVN